MPAFGTSQTDPVPSSSTLARHRVREGIHQGILSGRFQPSQRLVQQELAQRFGVAQSVVRESLLELQFCGLIEAIASNHPEEAERLARRHVRDARRAVEKQVDEGTFVAHFAGQAEPELQGDTSS